MATEIVKDMQIHDDEEQPWVEATIPLTISDLIDMQDYDDLNIYVESQIFDDDEAEIMDIRYRVVGCDTEDNIIWVKVIANLDFWE